MLAALEFKYPLNILFLILAVVAAVFFILSFGKKERIMAVLRPDYKIRFKALRALLLFIGLGLMAFSLTGPQLFEGYTEAVKTGMDIYVLMDTSKSMLVSDIKPDRMSIAKKIADNLLNSLDGDRVGFVPFASGAYIQMPLTDDYRLAEMFLDAIDTDMIGGGGTNLAAALQLANDSFKRTSGADRVILIISDGEEHDSESLEALKGIMAGEAQGLRVFAVGVGTEKGGLVPIYNDAGDTVTDYMKDSTGNPVTSRLNADNLIKLTQAANGKYYQATLQGTEIQSLLEDLSALTRDQYAAEKIRRFKPLYQYFLAAGILVFIIAWFLPETKARVRRSVIERKGGAAA